MRRRWHPLFSAVALFTLVITGVSACGGGGGSTVSTPPAPTGHPGTTSGTYLITITATSGTLTNSALVTLSVQ
jgi:hypothetical protein